MSDKNNIQITVGPGFLSLLTIAFIVLKLTDYIAWSWVWVLAPLWFPFFFALSIIAGVVFLTILIEVLDGRAKR